MCHILNDNKYDCMMKKTAYFLAEKIYSKNNRNLLSFHKPRQNKNIILKTGDSTYMSVVIKTTNLS